MYMTCKNNKWTEFKQIKNAEYKKDEGIELAVPLSIFGEAKSLTLNYTITTKKGTEYIFSSDQTGEIKIDLRK